MVKENISNYFENFLGRESLFKDKKVLQSSYTPGTIPHREAQINEIASILAPALKLERPSNLFVYGKTGTGKTLSVMHVVNNMEGIAKKNNLPITFFYLNCKLKRVADTEYRLIAHLTREIGEKVPVTGLPTDEIYRIFLSKLSAIAMDFCAGENRKRVHD